MIDRKFINHRLPPRVASIEAGQLRFFASATGETNPIYFDESAARQAGHRQLPAPPTFAFSLSLIALPQTNWMDELGIDIGSVLHGEQRFEYMKTLYAGDVVTLAGMITDIYSKKGGALEFVVMELDARNQHDELCVRQRMVTVVRHG